MDSSMIGKIEKAMQYSKEPDRVTFTQFSLKFNGDHTTHLVTYDDGQWTCDCGFYATRGVCSHTMTLERVLMGMVKPAQAVPVPA